MMNFLMKLGRRKAQTYGPPHKKENKRIAAKAVRRFFFKED